MLAKGRVFKFGDNIDTDLIIPARYLVTADSKQLAKHCMEDYSDQFARDVQPGDIILGGENFGCGSSREQAVVAILGCGIRLIMAKSFSRIFYRNGINRGLYLLEISDQIFNEIDNGDIIDIDLNKGKITKGERTFKIDSIQKEIKDIIEFGGIIEQTKFRLSSTKGGF